MKQNNIKGFTLTELIAVIVVISLIALIAVPSVIGTVNNSKDNISKAQESEIIRAAKDWLLEHPKELPVNGTSLKIKLGELKNGYISLNVKNLKTGNILSDESYVMVTNQNNKYDYKVKLYDIPEQIEQGSSCTINGDFNTATFSKTSDWDNLSKSFSTDCVTGYSIQYFIGDEEVSIIQSGKTYSVIYTFLSENKIYKRVKVITVR